MAEQEKHPFGRDLNEVCPTCGQGRLKMITHVDSGHDEIIGPGGHAWHHTIIDSLACSHCSLMFASKDRGTEINRHLDALTKSFTNPDEQPEYCPRCHGPLAEHRLISDGGFGCGPKKVRAIAHHCPDCLIVVWVEDKQAIPVPTQKLLEQALENLEGSVQGRRRSGG